VPVSALVSPMVCFMTTVPIRVSDASEHKSPSTTLVVCLTASQPPHLLQSPVFSGCQFSISDYKDPELCVPDKERSDT